MMIGQEAPRFELQGWRNDAAIRFALDELRGRWAILFFYPADFTFVCPTEIKGFDGRYDEFSEAGAEIVGISVDDLETHRNWATELGGLRFPLLCDTEKTVSRLYGVLNEEDGKAYRATFLIRPDGRIGYAVVSPMNVGRSVDETLRVLKALQTGRLCPADWRPGDATLDPAGKY